MIPLPPRLSTFVAPVRNEVLIRGSMTSQQKYGYAFSGNDSKLQAGCNLQAMPLASEDNVTSNDQLQSFEAEVSDFKGAMMARCGETCTRFGLSSPTGSYHNMNQ